MCGDVYKGWQGDIRIECGIVGSSKPSHVSYEMIDGVAEAKKSRLVYHGFAMMSQSVSD